MLFAVRGRVDDRLAAFLVPRPEVCAAPCYAAVDGKYSVREAGPGDGYSASLDALGVVCVDPGTQRAVANAEQIWLAHISRDGPESWSYLSHWDCYW